MKKVIVVILILATLCCLAGCMPKIKEAPSYDEFVKVAEENGWEIADCTKQFEETNLVVRCTVARSEDCQVEFFEFLQEEYAESSFVTNKESFEEQYDESDTGAYTTYAGTNWASYKVSYSTETGKQTAIVAYIGNTMLYAKASDADDINPIAKDLGYLN